MKNQKVLVTGGLGFVGSNTAIALKQKGVDVTVFDARVDGTGFNDYNLEGFDIPVVSGDCRNSAEIEKAVEGMNAVVHCAATVSHVDSMKDPLKDLQINLIGSINVLEACKKHGAKAVNVSSVRQYGKPLSIPINEESFENPVDAYGVNKLAADKYFALYANAFGLETTTVVLTNCYGPRQQVRLPKFGIINYFVRLGLEGKDLTVFGEGTQLRDYVYINDAVEAILLALEKGSGKYCVGSSQPIAFIKMAEAIAEETNSKVVKQPWPADWKAIEAGDFSMNSEKIARELGWKQKTGFEEGILKTIDYYKKNLKHYV